MWFSFDGHQFNTYETAEAAKKDANDALEMFRDEAPEGWAEEAYQVCWGRILEHAEIVSERPATEDDCCVGSVDTIQEINLIGMREYRCGVCGGIVIFDGTAPTERFPGPGRK